MITRKVNEPVIQEGEVPINIILDEYEICYRKELKPNEKDTSVIGLSNNLKKKEFYNVEAGNMLFSFLGRGYKNIYNDYNFLKDDAIPVFSTLNGILLTDYMDSYTLLHYLKFIGISLQPLNAIDLKCFENEKSEEELKKVSAIRGKSNKSGRLNIRAVCPYRLEYGCSIKFWIPIFIPSITKDIEFSNYFKEFYLSKQRIMPYIIPHRQNSINLRYLQNISQYTAGIEVLPFKNIKDKRKEYSLFETTKFFSLARISEGLLFLYFLLKKGFININEGIDGLIGISDGLGITGKMDNKVIKDLNTFYMAYELDDPVLKKFHTKKETNPEKISEKDFDKDRQEKIENFEKNCYNSINILDAFHKKLNAFENKLIIGRTTRDYKANDKIQQIVETDVYF